MYLDGRGHFHMLVHRFASANGSTAGASVGGHAWSNDGIVWSYDRDQVAYTTEVTWPSGSRSTLYRRERPKPLVDQASGAIRMLFNGAWPCAPDRLERTERSNAHPHSHPPHGPLDPRHS